MNNQKLAHLVTDAGAAVASDLHVMAGHRPAFRVNGEIVLAEEGPLTAEEVTTMAFSLLDAAQRARFERDGEVTAGVGHAIAGRLRATLYRRDGQPELSLRLCGDHIPPRAALGLPAKVDDLLLRPAGLVLVAGPSGSGRTTTLNYLLDRLNRTRRCRIVTVEDPVEYRHVAQQALVLQQEVHTDTRSAAAGLQHALRADADVLAVGEVTDAETAAAAILAADTGHLVLATLRAAGAVGALERLAGWPAGPGPGPHLRQLAHGFLGVLAQRLVPGADGRRRVLATEFLPAVASVRELIRAAAWPQLEAELQAGRIEHAETLDDGLARLAAAGLIAHETALAHARVPARLPRPPA
jgi:twitching motility protein PilT